MSSDLMNESTWDFNPSQTDPDQQDAVSKDEWVPVSSGGENTTFMGRSGRLYTADNVMCSDSTGMLYSHQEWIAHCRENASPSRENVSPTVLQQFVAWMSSFF